MKKEIFKGNQFYQFLKLIDKLPKGKYNFKKFIPYSYGIILYKKESSHISYLLCQRRYTNEYVLFISGKYSLYQLFDLFSLMSDKEKLNLKTFTFHELWIDLFSHLKNYSGAKYKFENILPYIDNIMNLTSSVCQNEWVLPKGKMMSNESNLQTAQREFKEEIGVDISNLTPTHYYPFKEIICGSDGNKFISFYFLVEWKQDKFFCEPTLKRLNEITLNEEIKYFHWFQISNQDFDEEFQKLSQSVIDERVNILYNAHTLLQKEKIYYITVRKLFYPKDEEDKSTFDLKQDGKIGNIIIV